MTGIEDVTLRQVMVHKVGNPSRGEDLKLSEQPIVLEDPIVTGLLTKYFLGAFNENAVVQADGQARNVQGVVGASPDGQPFDLDDHTRGVSVVLSMSADPAGGRAEAGRPSPVPLGQRHVGTLQQFVQETTDFKSRCETTFGNVDRTGDFFRPRRIFESLDRRR